MNESTGAITSLSSSTPVFVGGRLDVQQVVEHYTAGKISIVPVVIRNPFDKAIEILDLVVPNSTFVRAESRPVKTVQLRDDGLEETTNTPDGRSSFGHNIIAVLSRIFASISGITIGPFELYRVTPKSSGRILNIRAQEGSTVAYDIADRGLSAINVEAGPNATVKVSDEAQRNLERRARITIPPHCEIVETFAFRAGHSMWSQPTTVNTNIQIDYELDGSRKTQVVPITATVRPAPAAIVSGAILGAIIGSLARGNNPLEQATMLTALTSVFMSIIGAIALSRKSGSQSVVTVEDFYGGFLIGALIGYGGASVFEDAIRRPPAAPAPS